MKISPTLFDTVRLTDDLSDEDLIAGALGAIVAIFDHPSETYEIEFADPSGKAIAVLALRREQFDLVNA